MIAFLLLGASVPLALCLAFIWLFLHRTRKAICVAPPGSLVSNAFGMQYQPHEWEYQKVRRQ